MTEVPRGWFPDPNDARQWRYWDGSAWTEQIAPRAPQPEQMAPPQPAPWTAPSGTVAGGMVMRDAVLLAVFVPLAAFVIGCIELARDHGGRGLLFLLIGIVSLVVWVAILASL